MQTSILFANKITLYLNIIFSDRTFFSRPHKIALLPDGTPSDEGSGFASEC
ncbi:hypothetical protein GXM_08714 [Nostoc sphaeroides CCNUC1]|uniref:Uncharacterized protein n=1 Tax=Nostoc sphaeroides CCNUC1 TaxID=2653204 RepID=A0A5P8WF49_9NOSO|nr:hypothetical protein GXM_08714 [Nostoc sphaeroides CCNUC1]